jgi:hypothetical protein
VHRRKSSVWKPILTRDRSSSAILTALQLNAERNAMNAPANIESMLADEGSRQHTQEEQEMVLRTPKQQPVAQQQREDHPLAPFRFPQVADTPAPEVAVSQPDPDDSSDTASPTSDTTLCEESAVYSLSQLKSGEGTQAHSAYDGTQRTQAPISKAPRTKKEAAITAQRRRTQHQRYVSTDSAFNVAETASISLRSRAKTNDGLLLFKAKMTRDPMAPPRKPIGHRRKISLNLPVNAPVARPEVLRLLKHPNMDSWNDSPNRAKTVHAITTTSALTPEERDIEYKHRHTFIGTGSLDDFIEALELSTSHTTTKNAVARAFAQLSSTEQLYARQCSTRPDGWELVPRTTLDVLDVTSVDYVVQLQVKLGSVTLRQFLDMIPFDKNNEVAAMSVVEAFCAASHIDSNAGVGASSKARAFRSWIVTQKSNTGN